MLRTENPDGRPDVIWCHDLVALADSRAEADRLFRALHTLGYPLILAKHGLSPDVPGTEYAIRWAKALNAAAPYWRRKAEAAKTLKPRRRGKALASTGGRPAGLTAAEEDDVIQMRDVEMANWPAIQKRLAERGIQVDLRTVRRRYQKRKASADEAEA